MGSSLLVILAAMSVFAQMVIQGNCGRHSDRSMTPCILTPCPLTNIGSIDRLPVPWPWPASAYSCTIWFLQITLPPVEPRGVALQLLSAFKSHLLYWKMLPDDPDTKCPWLSTGAMALLMVLCLLSVIGWVALWAHCWSSFLLP